MRLYYHLLRFSNIVSSVVLGGMIISVSPVFAHGPEQILSEEALIEELVDLIESGEELLTAGTLGRVIN